MAANRLVDEKSPYLQQHAHNPVEWYPWGEEAFEKARREDKPIFLSVGYSTCHWCHVMERESFESVETAEVLNRHFVPVKVDREERPDVDRIYMMFVQATTGAGGWPMSVFLTPDLKPFFGGTYFPPDDRYGRPGFRSLLEHLAHAWMNERARILQSGSEVIAQLRRMSETRGVSLLGRDVLDSAFYTFRRGFDTHLGGFGGAPKFPRPVTHNFLLRYHRATRNEEALDMVLLTLREMAKGGMYDQIGGGFHRYSVDERWFVPHFEKMLYDQAQLAASYLEAFQITREDRYAAVARDVFEYVLRDLTHPGGAFYSAEDADSAIDPADPKVKGEGAFYVWGGDELDSILGAGLGERFVRAYGVEKDGNVHHDPHGEFTGKNILYQAGDTSEFQDARGMLLEARSRRPRPHLDDKILTAWNGLMISAFAKGAQVLDEPRYLARARRAADFIIANLYRDGALLRRWREGEAAVPGFLDDYAFFIQALIDLYETDFAATDLALAVTLAERALERFEDAEHGAFFSTAQGDASLILRMKDDYDGAEPSGNSMLTLALLRLAAITGREDFRASAERALRALASRLSGAASTAPQMLVAYMFSLAPPSQIILAGARDELGPMLRAVRRHFLPNTVVMPADDRYPAVDGAPAAYVCENFTCQLPATDVEKLDAMLKP